MKGFSLNRTGIGRDGNQLILASGSSDCSVKLWRLRQVGKDSAHPDYRFRSPSDLINELEHNSAVLCLDFDKYGNPFFINHQPFIIYDGLSFRSTDACKLVTGTKDGEVQLWDVRSGQLLNNLPGE
jgi:WD40 repeat protein